MSGSSCGPGQEGLVSELQRWRRKKKAALAALQAENERLKAALAASKTESERLKREKNKLERTMAVLLLHISVLLLRVYEVSWFGCAVSLRGGGELLCIVLVAILAHGDV